MIILYGGSFNPPTIAHYQISKYLINKYKPKVFIFVPVGNIYNKKALIPFEFRYQMVKILAEHLPNTLISEIENKKDFNGTIETLNYYQKIYENDDLYYVIGADNLLSFTSWINYQELLLRYKFIVLNRDNIKIKSLITENVDLQKYQSSFIIEDDAPIMSISATLYRDLHQDDVVIPEINDYIYRQQLYNRGERIEK